MSFNKHFPDRAAPPPARFTSVDRAFLLRMATWASLLMLVAGYVLIWVLW